MTHIPVLLDETIGALNPNPGENFIDGTFGWGGHSLAILGKTAPRGIVLGIEQDGESLAALPAAIKENPRLILENGNYADIAAIVRKHNFSNIAGVLFDLGMSSWHVDESGKGFSFSKNEPLRMKYDSSNPIDAAGIVNNYPAGELEKIFKTYGQEKFSKKIAIVIEKERCRRRIESTRQLVELIRGAVPPAQKMSAPARIFQALRIAVNREFENIKHGIVAGFEVLRPKGRMAVITFHSGEDKIVKDGFRALVDSGRAELIFKKPIVCSLEEARRNSRARSAKLRAIEKK